MLVLLNQVLMAVFANVAGPTFVHCCWHLTSILSAAVRVRSPTLLSDNIEYTLCAECKLFARNRPYDLPSYDNINDLLVDIHRQSSQRQSVSLNRLSAGCGIRREDSLLCIYQNSMFVNVNSAIVNSERGVVLQRLWRTVKLDNPHKIGRVYMGGLYLKKVYFRFLLALLSWRF